ncbi:hypothetical protein AB0J83_30365 [Actinoplanes sp. NPDC049596]|uniref:transketolase-like TK C-terminal-containing protein n=1 Tax=unclassified Actinoplanes TaxID=2626549 RepID=UPI00343AA636
MSVELSPRTLRHWGRRSDTITVPQVVRPAAPVHRDQVLPPALRARVSVDAGIGQGWRDIVGDAGRIVSLEHYGASADYQRLYQEFGITAEAVARAARDSIRASSGPIRPGGEQQTAAPTVGGTGDRSA